MAVEAEAHVIDLLPAFVLETLTGEEKQQVGEHLAVCSYCQAELLRFQQVVDDLPLAVAQSTPSPDLKRKLMQSIHTQRVQPALPQSSLTYLQALFVPIRRYLPAIGLALIILLFAGNLILWRQLNLVSRETTTSLRMVALVNTQLSSDARGTVVVNPNARNGTLVVADLSSLGASEQYQLWLIKGTDHISAGVFSVDRNGYASVEFFAPQPMQQYDAIGISVEPAGGSSQPTGPNVLRAYLW